MFLNSFGQIIGRSVPAQYINHEKGVILQEAE